MQSVMSSEYTCPLCNAGITLDDVNVATDIALCRACGKSSAFSSLAGAAEITMSALQQPPKHITLSKDMLNGTVITYRKISAILLFLIPFTALWSGGSMWGIYGTQISRGEFSLGESLFGLPFLFGTFVLLAVIAALLFGSWKITLHKGQGTVFFGAGSLGWSRRFTYNNDSIISLRHTAVKINNVAQKGIHIQNGATSFAFGTLFSEDAKQFIAASIINEAKNASLSNSFI